MDTKLYVGNLEYTVSSSDLSQLFSPFGGVLSVSIIQNRDTGRSKGFGFVEMATPREAQAAMTGLHGHVLAGRALVVSEARTRASPGGTVRWSQPNVPEPRRGR